MNITSAGDRAKTLHLFRDVNGHACVLCGLVAENSDGTHSFYYKTSAVMYDDRVCDRKAFEVFLVMGS